MAVTDARVTLDADHPLAGKDLIPPPAFQATPTALPYPILRRLSSTSQSGAAPCFAWLRDAPAGGQGGGAKKGVWISYTLGGERPRLRRAGSVNSALYGDYALQKGSSSWDLPRS
jgi:hypothetical protein